MADKFILEFAKMIADRPDEIKVKRVDKDDSFSEIILYANRVDTGKLIGRGGQMIGSLKTVINGCKAKESRSYRVTIKENE
jgi:predicted RNA-binding protein YlqC (UPF0109 family)